MQETVDELFPDTPATVRAVIGQLRIVVRSAIPEATEIIYHGALGYGPTTSGFDRIIYIAPQNGYVNLGFFFGGHLADPAKLLEGTGKRMRHVKIRTTQAADNPALPHLIQEAWADGIASVAKLHEALRNKS
jgi:hypothetical protein